MFVDIIERDILQKINIMAAVEASEKKNENIS